MNALQLSHLDLIAFIGVIVVTLAAIIYGNARKSKGESDSFIDYLIMGRQLTLPMFIATLVATWYGGIFGVTQIAFESGVYNFVTQGVFWYITYIIFALFLVKHIRSFNVASLPELVGKMYGPKARKVAALFNVFNVIPVAYTISLGILIQQGLGWEPLPSMIAGVSFVFIYSSFGGFRSVVFSDLVQFFFMCFGVLLVAVLALTTYGGYEFLSAKLPAAHFTLTGGNSVGVTLAWGFIAISTLVDPNFYQRCFAAKSEKVARNGILLSTLIWFVFDLCTTLGGMYARAVMPEAEASTSYLAFSMQLLPDGLRGLFLGSLVATVLSTIDSYLFVAGSTVSYDLFKSKKDAIFKTRLSILIIAILSILLAVAFDGNIKKVWKTLGTYSTACLLFPVLCGYIMKQKITDMQFVMTALIGVITTSIWRNFPHQGFAANIDELYIGLLSTGGSILVFHLLNSRQRERL